MNSARKRPRRDENLNTVHEGDFSASATFEGSRPGFVFRSGEQGIGYYRDNIHDDNNNNNKNDQKRDISRPRKGVRIAEELNVTRTFQAPESLLQKAEQEAEGSRGVVLDLRHPERLRNSLKAWYKATQDNELQRAQYADDPRQYMESEVALYEHVHAWKAVAADPTLFYPLLMATDGNDDVNAATLLSPLLQHVNTDVSRVAVNLLLEWLDPALLLPDQEDPQTDGGLCTAVMDLASFVIQEGLLDLVLANLGRFAVEEAAEDGAAVAAPAIAADDDQVGQGVWDILALVENLLDMETTILATAPQAPRVTLQSNGMTMATYLAQHHILGWLVAAASGDNEEQPQFRRYRERALELLVLLAPLEDVYMVCPDWTQIPPYNSSLVEDDDNDGKNNKKEDKKKSQGTGSLDAIEMLLQTVAKYRKKQPSTDDEVEILENAAMILNSALTYSKINMTAFLQAQGIELVVRCLKERVHAAGVALPWLDVPGTSDKVYRQACEHMVKAKLYKYLLPLWMGRALPSMAGSNTTAKAQKTWKHNLERCTIRIVYVLTRHLTADSPEDAQERLVAKFASDPTKLERLVTYLLFYDQKARTAEYKFYRSDVEESFTDRQAVQLAALDAKLAGGGDLFHRLGAIAAFLCAHSKQCHQHIWEALQGKGSGMGLIRAAVEEFASVLEEASPQRLQLEAYLEAL